MNDLDQKILTAVTGLPAFSWQWHGRGSAPAGYLKGLALAFARAYNKLKAGDRSAKLMAQADREDNDTDALSWYSQRFSNVNYDNTKDGVDTLRHLFVLLTGLGMRESSGQYREGRDITADNETSSTAEAGLFQQSYNSFDGVGKTSQEAEDQMNKVFSSYQDAGVDGYLDVFKEGVPGSISTDWGSGAGRLFQNLCKTKPAFACEIAALGLRYLRTQWGPIDRREAELNGYVNQMFQVVQGVVDVQQPQPVAALMPAPALELDAAGPLPGIAPAVVSEAAGPLPGVPAQPAQKVFSITDITAVMRQHSCQIDYGNDRVNICYCEGMDMILPDAKTFKPNQNRPNAFDSLRIVFQGDTFENMKILGMWSAITHAGLYYEKEVLLDPGGAFHIAVGRQSAWRYGIYHHGNYPALLNTEPLFGTRDKNKNFLREGPTIQEIVGAHHHWGYNFPKDDVRTAAAGCQVGEDEDGHMDFIKICRSDPLFKADYNFLWSSTVIPPEWFTG